MDTYSAPTAVERRRSNFEPRMGLFQRKKDILSGCPFSSNRSDRRRKVSGGHLLCADRSGTEMLELRALDGALSTKKDILSGCPFLLNKSDRRGSNPRSRPWQGRALPTTPLSHLLSLLCHISQARVI